MKKSLLVDVLRGEIEVVEISNVEEICKLIGCDYLDVAGRYVGDENRWFDIFVDDCGLLYDGAILSAIDASGDCALVGNLVITKTAPDGEQVSLTDDDINYLYQYIKIAFNFDLWQAYPILVDVKYTKD